MTITLRLGYTESTLLYYFYMQTVHNDINIHEINAMLSWFYKTSGYYDKTINDIGIHCIHSQNYIQYFEKLINIIQNSTFTILLLHEGPKVYLNNHENRNKFENFLHNKVLMQGYADDYWQHYVAPRFTSKNILVINPLSELMLEQYESGNVYKAHNDFPPSVVGMITYKSINTFFNDGPDNNNIETCEKNVNEILALERVYDTIWISCGSYSCLIAYYLSKHLDVNISIFGGTDINNIFAIKHQRNEILNPNAEYNEFWVSVPEHLKPHNYKLIEHGCYW